MQGFLLALQFLTILPIRFKKIDRNNFSQSAVYFPLVGLILGFLLCLIYKFLFGLGFTDISTSIILTVTLIFFTQGLHLDGLIDTADAFYASKNKEEALRIMRDPHAGASGVLSVICVILLKISLLDSVSSGGKAAALILMCVLSRWALVVSMSLLPYARENGKAKVFKEGMNLNKLILASLISFVCALLSADVKGLIILSITVVFVYLLGLHIKKKIGGFTGDTLGATCELTEIVVLASLIIMERSGL